MPHTPKLSYLPDFEGSTSLYRKLAPPSLKHIEVRVFTVWPNEDFSSPLEGALEIRSLSDLRPKGPFYDALSYYWGSANDLDHVIIHGSDESRPTPSSEVPVTKNLASALRHLRKEATTAGRPLEMWTDAVCINQRDAQERGEQVNIMAGIFQMSRCIFVWLSDRHCGRLAGVGLNYVANLCDRFSVHKDDGELQEEQLASYIADQGWNTSEMVDSIEELVDLPYWRRGWILQEISAINTPIIIKLGHETCNLVGFGVFTKVLHALMRNTVANHRPRRRSFVATSIFTIAVPIEAALGMRRIRWADEVLTPKGRAQLDDSLDSFLSEKMWHTSDPRDSVFVLREIHPAFTDLDTNYEATVEQVFAYGTLLLLSEGTWSRTCWCEPSQSPYLPSWVIDFSRSMIHNLRDSVVDSKMLHSQFDACGGSEARYGFTMAPQLLSTAAFVYDKVDRITRCITTSEREDISVDATLDVWTELLGYGVTADLDGLIRTLSAGIDLRHKPFTKEDSLHLWNHLLNYVCKTPGRSTSEARERALKEWTESASSVALTKRYFITKGGRIGVASNAAAVGDEIAIFASGKLPFVVRNVTPNTDTGPGAHILLGTCYVHGIMYGEAVYERGQRKYEALLDGDGCLALSRTRRLDALSLERGRFVNIAAYTRWHMLKRTRSLDSGKLAKSVAVNLAFHEDDLHLA